LVVGGLESGSGKSAPKMTEKTGGPSTGINHNQESQPCLESYVKLAKKQFNSKRKIHNNFKI